MGLTLRDGELDKQTVFFLDSSKYKGGKMWEADLDRGAREISLRTDTRAHVNIL